MRRVTLDTGLRQYDTLELLTKLLNLLECMVGGVLDGIR